MLTAAAALFTENGYEETSIEQVTDRADVSKGTFYYHFQSKEELVVELRRWALSDTTNKAFEALRSGVAPLVALERLLLDRASFTEKQPELARVFFAQRIQQILFREENDIQTEQPDGQPKRLFRRAIYELICEAQKLGQIRADLTPQEVTGMIVACFLHAQGAWLSGDRSSSLVDKVHRWVHVLMEGVAEKGYRDLAPHCSSNSEH